MNVEFNEKQPLNYNYQPKKKGITNMIIKLHLAKDEAGAQKVMIIIAVLCFALSFYFFYKAM